MSQGQASQKPIAIFCDLEWFGSSAITLCSVDTFCVYPDLFHIFTTFPNELHQEAVLKAIEKHLQQPIGKMQIYTVDQYEEMDAQYHYSANIFIIGNSKYNLASLNSAIKLYQHRHRNYLYFHDGLYTGLLSAWIEEHHYDWKGFVRHYYPGLKNIFLTLDIIRNAGVHMIKPLIDLTGVSKIFVNAENCIPIIEQEVGCHRLTIEKAFLPIPDLRKIQSIRLYDDNTVVIAHFGIPHSFKQTDKLIQAVDLLRQKITTKEIKLLLAGFGVKNYLGYFPKAYQQFIITEEAPSSDRMHELMKSVDVAVQLRYPINGESSGVVSEMLGLGKKCLTTQGFVNSERESYVIPVLPSISVEELADTIWQHVEHTSQMTISSQDHQLLLDRFSYKQSAHHIFQKATIVSLPNAAPNTEKKKLRILYGASHRILRFEEVPLLIKAGFEVIPVMSHWEVFKSQEPGVDDAEHALYPEWKSTCTIPEDVIKKIQAIDLFHYQDLNDKGGYISSKNRALLNEWIDIIYIPNLLPVVPRVLTWFEGLTLFRVYGEGDIMTYDEWAAQSHTDLSILKKYDARYAAMLMLHSLNGKEHETILGSNIFHVGPCVSPQRITSRWAGRQSERVCNLTLSYIHENPHWTKMYHLLGLAFKQLPLQILGKNNKTHPELKQDDRVVGTITDDERYMALLTSARCLIDPGTSPFHTHYTPLEAMVMGIPVIFLKSSGMAHEILRVMPESILEQAGMCHNVEGMVMLVQRCLDDVDFAIQLSEQQQTIINKVFLPETTLKAFSVFAEAAPNLVNDARCFSNSLPWRKHVLVTSDWSSLLIMKARRVKSFIKPKVKKLLRPAWRILKNLS